MMFVPGIALTRIAGTGIRTVTSAEMIVRGILENNLIVFIKFNK
jgi:hypothetical protein